ncbi:MAG: beta strand repeat-containing protein [Gemmataceae bacterium]
MLTNPGNQTNLRGDSVSLQLSSTQVDNDPITYSASNLPTGLSINADTGLISGTVDPSATLGVPYAVTVTATDDTTNLSASQNFNWTINATNVAPVLTSPGNQINSAGDQVSLQLSGTDADGDALTYTASGLPPGLTLDPIAGTITGTLPNSAASSTPYNVTVTASDGNASNSQSFTWMVNAVSLQNPGDQSNLDGDSVSLQLTASDANNATLTYSASGLPSGLSINSGTGLISGAIASNADTSSPYSVTVTATDSNNNSVSQAFNWTVARVALNPVSDQENQEETAVSLQLSATDNEATPTYSATGLPPGLSIDSTTGLISGTVGIGAFGSSPYQVTATATDGSNTSSQSFVWTVTPRVALVNPGSQSNATGDSVSLQLSATSPGGTMSFSASGLPPGLSISSSGLISGSPTTAISTPYNVTVTANDGTSSSSQTFQWTVSVINLVSPGDQTNNDGDTVSLSLTTGYNAGGMLNYSASGLPTGLSINSSTGQITGTISGTADTNSPYSVTVTVTDGTNTSSQTFNWTVNQVVAIDAINDQSNAAGDAVSLQVSASDSFNNTLTYSATGLPSGLSISSTTGLIGGTIALGDDANSPYAVTVTATDSAGNSSTQSFNWNVAHVSLIDPGVQSSLDGSTVSLQLQGHDADGDTVGYSANGLPSGLSINAGSGLISGTIASNADTNSPYAVSVSASDGANTTTQTFLWTVSQVTLTLPSAQTNTEGDNVSLQLQGTASSGSLSYNASGLPPGLSLNSTTGLITGTIAAGDAATGPYTVDVSVTNGNDSVSQSFTWTVNPVVNLTALADQSNNVGDTVSLQISATDSLNKSLTYTAVGLPSGLSINSSTGLITGTISTGDSSGGPFVATVTASDGTYTSCVTFNWNVTDTTALTMTVPSTQVNVGSDSANLQVTASDPDGDALSYSATNLPDGLNIDPVTGIISGSLAEDAPSTTPYQVTVTATDGNGQSVSQTFSWLVNSPPITAQSVPINAQEGVDPGSFTVATFTTPDMNSLAGDFTATINYGDGTTDTGAISGGNGSFTVTADHVYSEIGSYPVSVQIADSLTGGSASVSTTATVADAALTMTGGFQYGDAFTNAQSGYVLATFTDANPAAPLSDYLVSINWGDGIITNGTGVSYVASVGNGLYEIVVPHNYTNPYPLPGPTTYTVTVTLTDVDGASAQATDTVVVGVITAGVPATMGQWAFVDQNTVATPSDFIAQGQTGVAVINWGDGTTSLGTVSGGGSSGYFNIVAAPHTYLQDSIDQPNGLYTITMTVTDDDGNTLTGTQYVSVVRPEESLNVANVNIASNLTVSNVQVAAFTVPNATDGASEFTAQINWGDGNSSNGTIQEVSPGLFQVLGSHTYAVYDWYNVTVTISQGWNTKEASAENVARAGGGPVVNFWSWVPQKFGPAKYQTVNNLSVGKWQNAFLNATQNPRLRNNFISFDPSRFWVQVKDPVAYKNANSVQVYVQTSSDSGHDITLNKSKVQNVFGGELQTVNGKIVNYSPPLLLTTFSVDKAAGGNQTLYVKLGDTVSAINGEEDSVATVPIKKVVHLYINILRKTNGGNPVKTIPEVKGDYFIANKIYAAAGIRFVIDKIQYVNPPAGVVLNNNDNPTQNGLACRFGFWTGADLLNADNSYRLTPEEQALLNAKALWPAKTNVIKVYYVNYLANRAGNDTGGYGESFPARNQLEGSNYANSIIISADDEKYQTLAHEIGHLLLNNGKHDSRIVNLMFGSGTGGDALPQVKGEVTDSRRITADEAKAMQNNPLVTIP